MKFLVGILLFATLAEFSVATKILTKFDLAINKKYLLQREPPLDKFATFADVFVETKWIEQKLNNFDPQDERVWNMRYMENKDYLQPGGPIFINIGECLSILK